MIGALTMALDEFYNAFGFYPPTANSFNPDTGSFDGLPYGSYGYSKALVQCLANQFTKGAGDTPLTVGLTKVYIGRNKVIGNAPVTAGPFLEIKDRDATVVDEVTPGVPGFPLLVDPWDSAYIYIPRDDYLTPAMAYNAGALVKNTDGSDPNPTLSPPNDHCQRFKFQLISLGPDKWTPGITDLRNVSIAANPYAPLAAPQLGTNPALVGTDNEPSRPRTGTDTSHTDGTADDINNWK